MAENFNELWAALVKKRPALGKDVKIEMTPENLRSLCRQFFEKGEKRQSGGADLFGELFKGFR